MSLEFLITSFLQSCILALVSLAMVLSYRFLQLQDLTPEGSYSFGGALCAALLILNVPPMVATFFAAIIGGTLGIITALLYLRLQVNTLLAGIIVTLMVYSINLRLLGTSNVGLFSHPTLLASTQPLLLFSFVIVILVILITLFLKTELGLRFRAIGFNFVLCKQISIKTDYYLIAGLFISNSIAALAGSFMVQMQQYMDVGLGRGIIIQALAALIMGECIVGRTTNLRQLIAPVVGAILFVFIQGFALTAGLQPSDLNLFTGAVMISVLFIARRHHESR